MGNLVKSFTFDISHVWVENKGQDLPSSAQTLGLASQLDAFKWILIAT